MHDDEKNLVVRAKQGDTAAFEQLVLRYQKKIFQTAYWYTGNTDDAADITQEVFVAAFATLQRFREQSSFFTWLNWLLLDQCSRTFRRKKNKIVSLDQTLDNGDEEGKPIEVADSSETLLGTLVKAEQQKRVLNAIHSLKEKYRVPLILCDIEKHSSHDAAHIARCSEGTLKSRLFRARILLKKKLMCTFTEQ